MIIISRLVYLLALVLAIYAQDLKENESNRNELPKISPKLPANHRPVSDLDSAPSRYHYGHPGRVLIKVYRGPEHDNYASHGYWVKQPADDLY